MPLPTEADLFPRWLIVSTNPNESHRIHRGSLIPWIGFTAHELPEYVPFSSPKIFSMDFRLILQTLLSSSSLASARTLERDTIVEWVGHNQVGTLQGERPQNMCKNYNHPLHKPSNISLCSACWSILDPYPCFLGPEPVVPFRRVHQNMPGGPKLIVSF